jgi:hypothetical protein
VGFSRFTSERQLLGCLRGQVVSFAPPFPDRVEQRPTPECKELQPLIGGVGGPPHLQQMAVATKVEEASGG